MLILWQAVGLVRRGDVHNTCTYCKSMDYNTRQERIRTGGGKNQLTPPVNSYIYQLKNGKLERKVWEPFNILFSNSVHIDMM